MANGPLFLFGLLGFEGVWGLLCRIRHAAEIGKARANLKI